MTTSISKKDQIKTAIMNFLNKKGHSVARPEINKEVEKLGSSRTITRALAELKTEGLAIQSKDEATKIFSWVSTEPKTVETKTDSKKDKKDVDTKNPAGSSDKKESTKKSKSETKREKSQKKGKADTTDKSKKTKKTLAKDDIVNAAKDSKKGGTKKDSEKAPGKPKRNPPTPAGKKKVGVIATIIKLISKKARTKKQILAGLTKAFPEREPEKMMKTINVQVPSRLRKDKGLDIKKGNKGYKIVSK